MYRRTASTTRSAFTLVELLVVITIIGLLMGLILPAIQKVRVSGKRAQTGADISQLSAAATSFKQEFKIYPPDNFKIPTKVDSLDQNYNFLKSMYPRWQPQTAPNVPAPDGTPLSATIGGALTNEGQQLFGIQCLIYFTTGPEGTTGSTTKASGWAIDGPYAPTLGAASRKGPYFEYGGPALTLYAYNDAFGIPYIYFRSGVGGTYTSAPQGNLALGLVSPYKQAGKFVNSDSVQIISAGADKLYGPGTAWQPGQGAYDQSNPGADDMANFYGGKQLGAE